MPEEEEHEEPTPEPTPDPEPEPKHEDSEPGWVKRLEDKIDGLCKTLDEATHVDESLEELTPDEKPIGKPWTHGNPFKRG